MLVRVNKHHEQWAVGTVHLTVAQTCHMLMKASFSRTALEIKNQSGAHSLRRLGREAIESGRDRSRLSSR
jgi:hypothetical protein